MRIKNVELQTEKIRNFTHTFEFYTIHIQNIVSKCLQRTSDITVFVMQFSVEYCLLHAVRLTLTDTLTDTHAETYTHTNFEPMHLILNFVK